MDILVTIVIVVLTFVVFIPLVFVGVFKNSEDNAHNARTSH
ncbi:MAG: hypothetical protein UU64_C0005G0011 [candidate division WWE3 bacterium GW2011_GWF2_41_45]|uniref:Uncharacterized protein n=1 Tax=candidate division WWE3 bacterium GW2011_GWC2_41_23 TaxID=1619123 RepID=A0A0G0VP19_UNCKA|nr:MAG: hypothetical protein UU55_C0013G0030 [candidate division WWE3 bacterium GW2011_GWC2_41_23]KKS10350.1 MAG: hypothetical protein UU64_C0005G0011 [candidate division WWE3 bacterium GW2011_GWF2_41_45]KKS19738.1 MAG: hypothetical protein UU79_C0011G0011 [candidate division WWE3 bacterium GW2011_GWE1_41_72]KKS30224.1 MAG: hypothetical protein UU90_C0004G0004 [candidate division WWE3 bacterium GW2011_GWD2_42_11]KKS50824.1 MAG: hypothetical protein UV16_C0005G0004 [candidate division WWE3 bacte